MLIAAQVTVTGIDVVPIWMGDNHGVWCCHPSSLRMILNVGYESIRIKLHSLSLYSWALSLERHSLFLCLITCGWPSDVSSWSACQNNIERHVHSTRWIFSKHLLRQRDLGNGLLWQSELVCGLVVTSFLSDQEYSIDVVWLLCCMANTG